MMYGFCSNNALYSACLSFTIFFSFNSFWHRRFSFEIKSQPVDVYKSVGYKEHIILFHSLLNMKKQLSLIGLFLCLSHISLGQYSLKNVVKSGGLGKKI